MNWLLLDGGNSQVKWAVAAIAAPGGAPAGMPPGATFLAEGAEALEAPGWDARLQAAWSAAALGPLGAAHGCIVASATARTALEGAAARAAGLAIAWHGAAADFVADGARLVNGYRNPAQLGADRWHALIAARLAYPARALLVVSAGTATTIDSLTADGRFDGGVIAPGLRLMRDSLARGTAGLPQAAGHAVAAPDNTDDAIATGIYEAQLGLIERRIASAQARHGDPVLLVLSGGAAAQLLPGVAAGLAHDRRVTAIAIEHNLVLRGVLWRALLAGTGPVG